MDHRAERQVRDVVATVLGRPIGPDERLTRASEPGWDSLRHVEILLAIEGVCGVRFDEQEMGGLDSVEKLVDSVERHRAA